MKLNFLPALVAPLLFSTLVQAQIQTFQNTRDFGIAPFGSPSPANTENYGQVFTLTSASTLLDWTFYAEQGNAGSFCFAIAAWDGVKAVGDALYSVGAKYTGGAQALTFSGINTALDATTSYIAFVSVFHKSYPVSQVQFGGSFSDGGLSPGGFRLLQASAYGIGPLDRYTPWSSVPLGGMPTNMQYTAHFSAIVPEPQTYAMFALGLGVLGFIGRRRKSQPLAAP